jgi:exopolysaccharide biosynthesis polyprenyl glycosylphosphotransferase
VHDAEAVPQQALRDRDHNMGVTGGMTREVHAEERVRPVVPRLVPATATAGEAALRPSVLYTPDAAPSRRDSRRRRALAAADVLALVVAYALLTLIDAPSSTSAWLLLALPLWVVMNKVLRLYDRDANLVHKSSLNELPKIVQSITFGAAAAFLAGPLVGGAPDDRRQTIIFWVLACTLTPVFRYVARSLVRQAFPPERVLIVGSGHVAGLVARKLQLHREYGTEIVGYVDAPMEYESGSDAGIDHLGDVGDFEAVCHAHDVERVIIAFSSLAHENLLDMIRVSKRLHLKISVVPRLFEVIGHNVEIDQIEGMTLLGLRGLSRTHSTLLLKRAMDLVGATLLLLVAAPVMIAAAIAVKVTSPGPIFFFQQRVGRGNQPFRMLKFRTMVVGADDMKPALAHLNECDDKRMFKMADDPRVTRAGRLLRATSIDELPQLLNVLRGEMSLVGPRPLVPDETEHIIGWHRARLDLTPGLTGPWQVMGRNQIPFDEMVKIDYLYVTDWSLWNDIKLLIRTLPVVIGRRGS